MATNFPPPPAGAQPPRKKTSPLVWILIGILAFFVLIGGLVVGGGIFLYHRAKQAGFDPELAKRNPAVAAVKLMVAANPNAEIVSLDEDRGVVTVRDRKTGKTVTMNFEDIKNGRMSFETQGEGKVTLGAGANTRLPRWLPTYPGATDTQGSFSAEGREGEAAALAFSTSDPPNKVVEFYESALRQAGLKVTTVRQDQGGIVSGDEEEGQRSARIVVSSGSEKTQVTVSFQEK